METETQEYDVSGTRVVYSELPEPPDNPLNRPPVGFKKFAVSLAGFVATTTLACLLCNLFLTNYAVEKWDFSPFWFTFLFTLSVAIIYILFILKRALIWLIHLYQHHASDAVRLKCVFEPSCSEYMLLCINKFGVFRGVPKGIHRLLRCHPPNGGKDYP